MRVLCSRRDFGMKDRKFDENSPIANSDRIRQQSLTPFERASAWNDWTKSEWLSDWLKLARQRTNPN
jgi:hypothetical protein